MISAVRPRLRIAHGSLGMALAAFLTLAGCGLRTDPEPLSRKIPAPQDVRIWQREKTVMVSWRVQPANVVAVYGAASSYEVAVSRLPLGCMECPALAVRTVDLRPGIKPLVLEGERAYYQFDRDGPPASWSARVTARLKRGSSAPSPPAFVEDAGTVPGHGLQWEPVKEGEPSIRFYWDPRRERRVYTVTKMGGQVEQDVLFRANVYVRVPPGSWPETPVNPRPVEGLMWTVRESALPKAQDGSALEAMLRLVDRFGNEGPASAPVAIRLSSGGGP